MSLLLFGLLHVDVGLVHGLRDRSNRSHPSPPAGDPVMGLVQGAMTSPGVSRRHRLL